MYSHAIQTKIAQDLNLKRLNKVQFRPTVIQGEREGPLVKLIREIYNGDKHYEQLFFK